MLGTKRHHGSYGSVSFFREPPPKVRRFVLFAFSFSPGKGLEREMQGMRFGMIPRQSIHLVNSGIPGKNGSFLEVPSNSILNPGIRIFSGSHQKPRNSGCLKRMEKESIPLDSRITTCFHFSFHFLPFFLARIFHWLNMCFIPYLAPIALSRSNRIIGSSDQRSDPAAGLGHGRAAGPARGASRRIRRLGGGNAGRGDLGLDSG